VDSISVLVHFCFLNPLPTNVKITGSGGAVFFIFAKKFTIKVKFVKFRGYFGEVTALDFYPHF